MRSDTTPTATLTVAQLREHLNTSLCVDQTQKLVPHMAACLKAYDNVIGVNFPGGITSANLSALADNFQASLLTVGLTPDVTEKAVNSLLCCVPKDWVKTLVAKPGVDQEVQYGQVGPAVLNGLNNIEYLAISAAKTAKEVLASSSGNRLRP